MPDYTELIKKYVKKGFETVTNPKAIKTGVGSMITPGIGSMYKLFETKSGKPTSTVSKDTPSQQFTRRSYVAPKPHRPGGLDPAKRPDNKRVMKVVEKANNDKSVIENSNDYNVNNNYDVDSDSGSGSSNISEDIYKDFGGG